MSNLTSLPPVQNRMPAGSPDWLRRLGLLLAGATLVLPLSAWLAGPARWWSAFIVLPAYLLAGLAFVQRHRAGGRFHWGARILLGAGAIVMTVALIFMLGMDWHYAWTLMLIVPGLAMAAIARPRAPLGSARFGFAAWVASIGGSLAALGGVFLAQQLGILRVDAHFGGVAWWAPFIALPGWVALGCAWLTHARAAGTVLMVAGCLHLAAGLNEGLDLGWQWQLPILVAAAGAAVLLSAIRPTVQG